MLTSQPKLAEVDLVVVRAKFRAEVADLAGRAFKPRHYIRRKHLTKAWIRNPHQTLASEVVLVSNDVGDRQDGTDRGFDALELLQDFGGVPLSNPLTDEFI